MSKGFFCSGAYLKPFMKTLKFVKNWGRHGNKTGKIRESKINELSNLQVGDLLLRTDDLQAFCIKRAFLKTRYYKSGQMICL